MKERSAVLVLLLASLIWGFAFPFQNMAADVIGPLCFNGIRMLLGFIVLIPLTLKALYRHGWDRTYIKKLLTGGFVCALFMVGGSVFQQIGLAYTAAGKAGFITSLYSLLVPVFLFFLGKRVSGRTWCCVAIGLAGAFLLSYTGSLTKFNKGDIFVFICAVMFALQIIVIEKLGKELDGVDLSAMQFFFGGLMCLIPGLISEPLSFSIIKSAALPILYCGIMSCGLAYTFQIIGQKYVPSAKATLALSLESVWAAVGGALILGERLSVRELAGCVLLFSAVVISQLPEKSCAK